MKGIVTKKKRFESQTTGPQTNDEATIPEDPWDWYICLHEWLIFRVNVGKYTSPMDPQGINHWLISSMKLKHFESEELIAQHLFGI